MTSGTFKLVNISDILVERDVRQRRVLEKVDELATSIQRCGLINPIVITKEYVLVAGERRLEAHKLLGYDKIAVQFTEDLSKRELHMIELEENTKRVDLAWQDRVNAVAQYHELKAAEAAEAQDESWGQQDTADALGMDRGLVSKFLATKKMMDAGVKEVVEAPRLSTALNATARKLDRERASKVHEITAAIDANPVTPAALPGDLLPPVTAPETTAPASATPAAPVKSAIANLDFLVWSKDVQSIPFNFIHCDFPYGVNAGDKIGYSAAKSAGAYDDGADVYFELLETLLLRQDNFIDASAHMIFWFAMDYYQVTKERLEAAGWTVNPYPLHWHKSDNTGILPDPARGPRRIYETAFLCTRGDRKIVQPVANSFACATTKLYHTSEKAEAMLRHFFRMTVDEYSRVLDPTCGSGMAIRAAEAAGATYALGLEKNEDFAESARQNLARAGMAL